MNFPNSNNCKKCYNCLRCAFNVVHNITQQSGCFNNIYLAYNFILTLPYMQVTCKRIFSKLKNIKKVKNAIDYLPRYDGSYVINEY